MRRGPARLARDCAVLSLVLGCWQPPPDEDAGGDGGDGVADGGDGGGGDGGDGGGDTGDGPPTACGGGDIAWVGETGYGSLAGAIADTKEGETVAICPGTHNGRWVLHHGLHLTRIGSETTVLAGEGQGAVLVIEGGDVRLSGLQIVGGQGEPSDHAWMPIPGTLGGGIEASAAQSLVLEDCILKLNAADVGGAIAGPYGGHLELIDTELSWNIGGLGGGLAHLGPADAPAGSLVLTDVRLTENQAGEGAGVWARSLGSLSASGGSWSENTADPGYGGAAAIMDVVDVALRGIEISENDAFRAAGVRIYVDPAGPAVAGSQADLRELHLEDNDSAEQGAGLHIGHVETLSIAESTLESNRAKGGFGGGIFLRQPGTVTLASVSLLGNDVAGQGGGIAADRVGSLVLSDVEFRGNLADMGGGLWLDQTPAAGAGTVWSDSTPNDLETHSGTVLDPAPADFSCAAAGTCVQDR